MCVSRSAVHVLRTCWQCAPAAAVLVSSCLAAQAQVAAGHWTVSAVEGTATMIVGGSEAHRILQAATRGYPVMAGTTIVTEDDGTVVLVRRGDSITVYPNSQMTIAVVAAEDESGVLQEIGKLLFRMETRESRDFEVRTPYLAATIKGTVFTVAVGPTRATVAVAEGMVRVEPTTGGRIEMVRAGWAATADAGSGFVELARNRMNPAGGIVETADSSVGDSASTDAASSGLAAGGATAVDASPGKSAYDKSASDKSASGKSASGKSAPGSPR